MLAGSALEAALAACAKSETVSVASGDSTMEDDVRVVLVSHPDLGQRTGPVRAGGGPPALVKVSRDLFPGHVVAGRVPDRHASDAPDDGAVLTLLGHHADALVFGDGWESDPTCVVEFVASQLCDVPAFAADGTGLTSAVAVALLRAVETSRDDEPVGNSVVSEACRWIEAYGSVEPKDRQLRETSRAANTAYFVSFAAQTGWFRHSNMPAGPDRRRRPVADTVRELLSLSANSSVNVRTFRVASRQGNPFHYGLTDADQIAELVSRAASEGYFVIVNETVDQHDGGVSGVSLSGVAEFAPDATPRSVEQAGSCQTSTRLAGQILRTVYGPAIAVPDHQGKRVEFSCHPHRVGPRREQTLIWEIGADNSVLPATPPHWPNAFSRHIGDKTFGLLIAHLHGATVPHTKVINRRVAPFEFGTPTSTGEWWIRTAPAEAQPGLFTTERGWRDPFDLLATEDPEGLIASVLAQESVDAVWSGASAPRSDPAYPLLEGVPGYGEDFMLGRQDAEPIPGHVAQAVTTEIRRLESAIGRVRTEWVWDGRQVWIVQLHRMGSAAGDVLSDGAADSWLSYDPVDGLDVLRELVAEARTNRAGIVITRPVGITSHVGDILRKANIPGRFGTGLNPVER